MLRPVSASPWRQAIRSFALPSPSPAIEPVLMISDVSVVIQTEPCGQIIATPAEDVTFT